jgi:hypothetical protein
VDFNNCSLDDYVRLIPFFYSGATPAEIFTQGDLTLSIVAFLTIGFGFKLNDKLFTILNYVWATITMTWILAIIASRLISRTQLEIVDAIHARVFFNVGESWIIGFLVTSGLVTIYYLFINLKRTTR